MLFVEGSMKLTTIVFTVMTLLAGPGPETALQLANRGAKFFVDAHYAEAEALYRQALEAWPLDPAAALGKLVLTGNLGILLRTVGRYEEAEPILLDVVMKLDAAGELGYPDEARVLDHLAVLYRVKGDLRQAEAYALRAERLADDAEKAGNRQVMASIYLREGRYREARPLLLTDTASADGRTALTANLNLAVSALMQGDYREAEGYARRALELARNTIPGTHPAMATALHDLAQACRFQGQFAEAEQRYRQAIAIWQESLGPDHPDLANGLMGFAGFLHERQRDIAAEALQLRAIAILENAFGKDDPQVLTARIELADILRAEGRYTESEKLSRATVSAMKVAFKPNDGRLLHALKNHARLLAETKRKAEAAALLKQIEQMSSKSEALQ
jgi:Tfp pilus assembly protein PilF